MSTGCRSWQRRSRYLRRTGAAAGVDGGEDGSGKAKNMGAASHAVAPFVAAGFDIYLIWSIPALCFTRFLREYVRLPLPQWPS